MQLYSDEVVLRSKLALVAQTKMLDVEKTLFQQVCWICLRARLACFLLCSFVPVSLFFRCLCTCVFRTFLPLPITQLNPDAAVPAAMTERRAAVLAQLKALKERCLPLLQVWCCGNRSGCCWSAILRFFSKNFLADLNERRTRPSVPMM